MILKLVKMPTLWTMLIWLKTTVFSVINVISSPGDTVSDLFNGVNLILTGSPIWGSLCLGLTMVPGIVEGVTDFLQDKKTLGNMLRCVKYCLFGWVILPLQTASGFWKTLRNPPQPGDPITQVEVYSHVLKFLEANTEAVGQVILNTTILMISGLKDQVFLFPGDLQLVALAISFAMIIKSAGEQHFFERSPHYPASFYESLCVSCLFVPDIVFRVVCLSVLCVYTRWFALLPILCVNIYGAGKSGVDRGDRLETAAMSVISPSVFIDDDEDALACPTIQRRYYAWNRNTFACVMVPCVILVTILVNTTFVDQFGPLCQIHSLPDCSSSLLITAEMLNKVPILILSGLCTLVHQFCSETSLLARPMRWGEHIARNENGYIYRTDSSRV